MGIIDRLFNRKSASLSILSPSEWMFSPDVKSGVRVTHETALRCATVFRCVAVISDGVSTVPLKIFQKNGESREEANDHPLTYLLRVAPNGWQSSVEFRETIMFHVLMTGNAFVYKNFVRGVLSELIPVEPSNVSIRETVAGDLRYQITWRDGSMEEYGNDRIWHVRGPSWNTKSGLDMTKLAREAIGLALATEETHARLHGNGVQTSGVYSVDGTLSKEQHTQLSAYIKVHLAGIRNAMAPLILDHGAKWNPQGMSGVDAQHLETRRYQVEEICRMFGVMPLLVGMSDKTATYASAEQMFIAHATHTLRPWHRRMEASIQRNLLTRNDFINGFYPKFIDSELMRGAAKDRSQYYAQSVQTGIMTRNEAREREELNPLPGLDEPLTPVNMQIGMNNGGGNGTNGNPNP